MVVTDNPHTRYDSQGLLARRIQRLERMWLRTTVFAAAMLTAIGLVGPLGVERVDGQDIVVRLLDAPIQAIALQDAVAGAVFALVLLPTIGTLWFCWRMWRDTTDRDERIGRAVVAAAAVAIALTTVTVISTEGIPSMQWGWIPLLAGTTLSTWATFSTSGRALRGRQSGLG